MVRFLHGTQPMKTGAWLMLLVLVAGCDPVSSGIISGPASGPGSVQPRAPGPPAILVFRTEPGSRVYPGTAFNPVPEIQVLDSSFAPVANASTCVSLLLRLGKEDRTSQLNGPKRLCATNGVIRLDGSTVTQVPIYWNSPDPFPRFYLVATADGMATATSRGFDIY